MEQRDIPLIAAYWSQSNPDFMESMGVDLAKIPPAEEMINKLNSQLKLPIKERSTFALIWLYKKEAIGHCNVNPFEFGKSGSMHLHMWEAALRQKGVGQHLVRQSALYFVEHLKLQQLYSEPYALNTAPNKCLPKAGFKLAKTYHCIPGPVSFEQQVNRWEFIFSD